MTSISMLKFMLKGIVYSAAHGAKYGSIVGLIFGSPLVAYGMGTQSRAESESNQAHWGLGLGAEIIGWMALLSGPPVGFGCGMTIGISKQLGFTPLFKKIVTNYQKPLLISGVVSSVLYATYKSAKNRR